MTLLGKRIALSIETPQEGTTAGGIVTLAQKENLGKVVYIGTKLEGDIKVGDTVRFTTINHGKPVKYEGKQLFIFDEESIMAVIEA